MLGLSQRKNSHSSRRNLKAAAGPEDVVVQGREEEAGAEDEDQEAEDDRDQEAERNLEAEAAVGDRKNPGVGQEGHGASLEESLDQGASLRKSRGGLNQHLL